MKHFLRISDRSKHDIKEIFTKAEALSKETDKLLEGKCFILFFPDTSVRTRITFEKGIQDLGGTSILFPSETLDKRESLIDVTGYIANWADGIIVRHSDFSRIKELADVSDIPVINAMTSDNHPCEILSDLYAMKQMNHRWASLTYTFVGENANISKTWCAAAEILDLKLNHVSTENNRIKSDGRNYLLSENLDAVMPETDVVLVDSLPKTSLTDEYIKNYQVTLERMKYCKAGAVINPCPPFYRGEEIGDDIIESDYFVGYEFKKHLIHMQQAIILDCLDID